MILSLPKHPAVALPHGAVVQTAQPREGMEQDAGRNEAGKNHSMVLAKVPLCPVQSQVNVPHQTLRIYFHL